MPKVRRRGLPPALLDHLWARIDEREISIAQLELFATWLDTDRTFQKADGSSVFRR